MNLATKVRLAAWAVAGILLALPAVSAKPAKETFALGNLFATHCIQCHGKDGKGIGYFEGDGARLRLTPRHWAYLRMSEGCNQRCAFCTIPSIRGKMRSKSMDNILGEANDDGVLHIEAPNLDNPIEWDTNELRKVWENSIPDAMKI